MTSANIIERIYQQPFPNHFLAGISPFLAENIEHPTIHSLVLNAFKSFLTRNVMQFDYTRYKTHFIGSVAYYYKDILEEAAAATGIRTDTIVRNPMEGLRSYYSTVAETV